MIHARTLARQVYDHLLRRIFDGGLVPGSPLREVELAEELGVSRTPVREALGRLAEYGVVETRPNHGAIVRRLGRDELIHLHQVREALEGMAAEMACGRLDEVDFAQLDALAEAARDERAPGYFEACDEFDVGLHWLIADRSGNPVLAREIGKLLDMTMRIHDQLETVLIPSHRIDPGEPGELRRMCWHHHVAIIDALKSGKPDDCRRTMVTHLRATIQFKAGLMPPSDPGEPAGENGDGHGRQVRGPALPRPVPLPRKDR